MRTKLTRPGSLQLIDFPTQSFRPGARVGVKYHADDAIERSGGEDVPEVNDFLPSARPHSSLKLRFEDRTLTPLHFNGFLEDQKASSRTRALKQNTATAA